MTGGRAFLAVEVHGFGRGARRLGRDIHRFRRFLHGRGLDVHGLRSRTRDAALLQALDVERVTVVVHLDDDLIDFAAPVVRLVASLLDAAVHEEAFAAVGLHILHGALEFAQFRPGGLRNPVGLLGVAKGLRVLPLFVEASVFQNGLRLLVGDFKRILFRGLRKRGREKTNRKKRENRTDHGWEK